MSQSTGMPPRPQAGILGCLLTLAFSLGLESIVLGHRVPLQIEHLVLWASFAAGAFLYAAIRWIPDPRSKVAGLVGFIGLNINILLGMACGTIVYLGSSGWRGAIAVVLVGVGTALFSWFISKATMDLLAALFRKLT